MESRALKYTPPAPTLKRPEKKDESSPIETREGHNPLITEYCISKLNYRIQQEELSARIYLSMSMWLNNEGYTGAAKLWKKYSDEEMSHASPAREYLLAMGVQPNTPALEAPGNDYKGLPDIIYKSYDHEIEVTRQCTELAADSLKEGEHMLYQLALTYLKEQVEEHDKTQTWVDKLKTFGTAPDVLRMLDNEMGG